MKNLIQASTLASTKSTSPKRKEAMIQQPDWAHFKKLIFSFKDNQFGVFCLSHLSTALVQS